MSDAVPIHNNWSFPLCPGPDGAPIDWPQLETCFPPLREMASCPQDAEHHAEGDVLTHTRRVCEELVALRAWRELPGAERSVLFLATLLHDIGKPACTVEEGGRISSRGHARKGAQLARRLLYRPLPAGEARGLPVPFPRREQIVALIRHHGLPLGFLQKDPPQRALITASQTGSCQQMAILAEADARGRVCATQGELSERVELFRELAAELGCLDGPFPFASDHARVVFFEKPDGLHSYAAYDDTDFQVVLMSGLPAAGKDHWRASHLPGWPVISLDALRNEMEIDPAGDQGEVVARAKSEARDHLRARRPFVWNATNVSRPMRRQLAELFRAYRAKVRMVYVEAPYRVLLGRNRARTDPVPQAVLARLAERLEVPDLTEAHAVDYCLSG